MTDERTRQPPIRSDFDVTPLDDPGDKDGTVHRVWCYDKCSIGTPPRRERSHQQENLGPSRVSCDSRGSCPIALRRVIESVFDTLLEAPIGRSPNLHRIVVGLSREELSNRIKDDTFDKALVALKLSQEL